MIARTKQQFAFAALEVQRGLLALPSSAQSLILAANLTASQKPTYTDSPEIQNTRGLVDRFQEGLSAGEFNLKLLARPTGAGSLPAGAVLFQSLMGLQNQSANAVTYAQATGKPSFSLCYRRGYMVFYCLGATVHELKLALGHQGPVELDFSGRFLTRLWMGDDQMAVASLAAATQIAVTDVQRFAVGGRVYNPLCAAAGGTADEGAGQGYEIVAVDLVNHLLTLAAPLAFDWALGEEVKGWLPASLPQGSPILAKECSLLVGGVAGKVQTAELTLSDGVHYIEDEITNLGHPTDYIEAERKVSGSYSGYFRKEDAGLFAQGLSGAQASLDFVLGSQAGGRMTFSLPKVPFEVPGEAESGPALLLKRSFVALETLGNDSVSLRFD